jgi:hypothetical protein
LTSRKRISNLRRHLKLLTNSLKSLKLRTKKLRRRETRLLSSLKTVSTKRIKSWKKKIKQIEILQWHCLS